MRPTRILAVTFTRTAAQDLVDKPAQLGVQLRNNRIRKLHISNATRAFRGGSIVYGRSMRSIRGAGFLTWPHGELDTGVSLLAELRTPGMMSLADSDPRSQHRAEHTAGIVRTDWLREWPSTSPVHRRPRVLGRIGYTLHPAHCLFRFIGLKRVAIEPRGRKCPACQLRGSWFSLGSGDR
jgi:hypothetical protein